MNVGNQIRNYRKGRQFSQEDLAERFLYPGKPFPTGKRRKAIQIFKAYFY